jgi:hypothetical protein
MASNSYLGQNPAERERQALYAASGRVGQPQRTGVGAKPPVYQSPSMGLSTGGQARGKTSYQPGMGPAYTQMGLGLGADIAGRQATNALMKGGTSALTGAATPAWASGAAGMGAGIGINMAGNWLAEKKRVKEDVIDFGNHGDLIGQYGRRLEGTGGGLEHGAIKGATMGSNPALLAATGGISAGVGALAGLTAAAVTKNAPSAYTDLTVQDGEAGLRDAYRTYLGREGSDEEIMGRIRGQGWKEGQRWMGQNPLLEHMDEIQGSPEAQAYRARQGAVEAPEAVPGANEPTVETSVPAGATREPSYPGVQTSQGGPGLPKLQADGTYSAATTPTLTEAPEPGSDLPVPGPDASGWNTDGYQAPARVAQGFAPDPPDGWDRDKWNDPTHQTPKYVWGRITQDGDPNDIEQMLAAYPGASFDGKDKISGIEGLGPIDVYQGASQGGKKPQWYDINAAASEGGQGSPQGASMGGPSMSNALLQGFQGQQPGQRGFNAQQFSPLVLQYLLQGLGLDRAAARLER